MTASTRACRNSLRYTITQNAVREQVRRTKGHVLFTAHLSEQADAEQATLFEEDVLAGSSNELFSHLTNRALQFVRETVDANTWEAFWRTTLEDQAVEVVAAQLEMSPPAVRQAKYRVLCRLRTLLADR